MAVSFIGGGYRSCRRKPSPHRGQVCRFKYRLQWVDTLGFPSQRFWFNYRLQWVDTLGFPSQRFWSNYRLQWVDTLGFPSQRFWFKYRLQWVDTLGFRSQRFWFNYRLQWVDTLGFPSQRFWFSWIMTMTIFRNRNIGSFSFNCPTDNICNFWLLFFFTNGNSIFYLSNIAYYATIFHDTVS